MTICRLCRERTATRTVIITMSGSTGETATCLCKTCAQKLILREDWSTFGLEPDLAPTIDLYGSPHYTRSATADLEAIPGGRFR